MIQSSKNDNYMANFKIITINLPKSGKKIAFFDNMMTFVFPYLHNINGIALKLCVSYQFNIARQVKHKKSLSEHL
jgi:hypothetical protein